MKKTTLFLAFLTFSMLFFNCNRENEPQEEPQEEPQGTILNAVSDVDGNSYDAVRIGKQVWMQTNLRTKHFRDGSEIPTGTTAGVSNPYYYEPTTAQVPEYDVKTYGLFYNWAAVVDGRGLCPKGWHVPSDAEWTELGEYVGSKSEYCIDGNPDFIAKALASTVGWNPSDEVGTPGNKPEENNATAFSAVPAGSCYASMFGSAGIFAGFWTTTEYESGFAHCYFVDHSSADLIRYRDSKDDGLSVRCIRD